MKEDRKDGRLFDERQIARLFDREAVEQETQAFVERTLKNPKYVEAIEEAHKMAAEAVTGPSPREAPPSEREEALELPLPETPAVDVLPEPRIQINAPSNDTARNIRTTQPRIRRPVQPEAKVQDVSSVWAAQATKQEADAVEQQPATSTPRTRNRMALVLVGVVAVALSLWLIKLGSDALVAPVARLSSGMPSVHVVLPPSAEPSASVQPSATPMVKTAPSTKPKTPAPKPRATNSSSEPVPMFERKPQ